MMLTIKYTNYVRIIWKKKKSTFQLGIILQRIALKFNSVDGTSQVGVLLKEEI